MSTIPSLQVGARRVLRHKKLVAVYYLVNLAAAAVIVLPLAATIGRRLATSFESERMFANVDLAWIAETLLLYREGPALMLLAGAAGAGLLFYVIQVFLAGGTIALLSREDDTFFGAAARYFPRLLRLLLVSAVFYALVIAVSAGISAAIGKSRESSMEAWPWIVLNWTRLALVLFLAGFVNLVFDYAKIVLVTENGKGAVRATGRALRFVFRNLGRVLGIYWTCAILGLLFLAAYHGLSEVAGQNSVAAVAAIFVLRQLCMVARMWARIWTWSSEVSFYAAEQPVAPPLIPELAPAGPPEYEPEPPPVPEAQPAG